MALLWAAYSAAFLTSHLRVRLARRKHRLSDRPVLRARVSDLGLLLEAVSVFVVSAFRREGRDPLTGAVALVLGAASVTLVWAAVLHLGRQWRVRAMVAEDHTLVTTGPYAMVRHPIYASLFGMLAASALAVSRWEAALAGLLIYIAGTEIRVRAEEKLLERAFPEDFSHYRRRVRAYLPVLR